jgi:hypothetical protein
MKPNPTSVCVKICSVWRAPVFPTCSPTCPQTVSRPVECVRNGIVTTDDSCTGAKPTSKLDCPLPTSDCGNGQCNPNRDGTCNCFRGYRSAPGAPCTIAPVFANAMHSGTATFGGNVPPGTDISFSFNWEGDPKQAIKALAYRVNVETDQLAEFPLYMGGTFLADEGSPRRALPTTAGTYRILLSISPTINTTVGEDIVVNDPCVLYSCAPFGNFDDCSLQTCVCLGGYSGPNCRVPPAESCRVNGVIKTCSDRGSVNSETCDCECQNKWDPTDDCATCSLECPLGSDSTCSSCNEPAQKVVFSFPGKFTSPINVFTNIVKADVSVTGYRTSTLSCVYETEPDRGTCTAEVIQSSTGNGRRLLQTGNGFAADLGDAQSELGNGVITSLVDRSGILSDTDSPTTSPTTSQPTSQPTTAPTGSPTTSQPTSQPTSAPTKVGQQVAVCEWQWANLKCAVGTIQVTGAAFGSSDNDVCKELPNNREELCPFETEAALTDVKATCDGKKDCDIYVTPKNLGGIDNDPCPGLSKYLITSYLCVLGDVASAPGDGATPDLPTETDIAFGPVCTGESLETGTCPTGYSVLVTEATFGSKDPSICSFGVSAPDCESDVTQYYLGRCDFKDSCNAPVSPMQLDAAYTTEICGAGYLTGSFQCVPMV